MDGPQVEMSGQTDTHHVDDTAVDDTASAALSQMNPNRHKITS
jgi:hypothetical protein